MYNYYYFFFIHNIDPCLNGPKKILSSDLTDITHQVSRFCENQSYIKNTIPINKHHFMFCQVHHCNISLSASSDDTSTWTQCIPLVGLQTTHTYTMLTFTAVIITEAKRIATLEYSAGRSKLPFIIRLLSYTECSVWMNCSQRANNRVNIKNWFPIKKGKVYIYLC